MIYKIFTVYDSKTEAYLQPFFQATRGQAIRGFSDAVNDKTTMFYKHPEDYSLFEVGSYDDSTAEFACSAPHVNLGKAIEFIKPSEGLRSVQ